ncbi:MAG: NADH-quinone oxidoreductase subunit L, partial [Halorientalis sp.]
MGGLKEKMPVTYYAFLSGSLALAGIIPFAGFWSKDEVLFESLIHGLNGNPLILAGWAMGLLAVFFTGFYTFRMVALTFHGEPRSDTAEDPHGVRWNVKLPLAILGILAATVGLINMTPVAELTGLKIDFLTKWLEGSELARSFGTGLETYHELLPYHATYPLGSPSTSMLASAAVSLALALAGAGLAWSLYSGPDPEEHTDKLGGMKTILMHNYYQDEYQVWLAQGVTLPLARAADRFDQGIIDGIVNGVSSVSLFSGDRVRRIQTGVVSNYAAFLTLGLTLLLVAFGVYRGWF